MKLTELKRMTAIQTIYRMFSLKLQFKTNFILTSIPVNGRLNVFF